LVIRCDAAPVIDDVGCEFIGDVYREDNGGGAGVANAVADRFGDDRFGQLRTDDVDGPEIGTLVVMTRLSVSCDSASRT
jgi:hypothetical protein